MVNFPTDGRRAITMRFNRGIRTCHRAFADGHVSAWIAAHPGEVENHSSLPVPVLWFIALMITLSPHGWSAEGNSASVTQYPSFRNACASFFARSCLAWGLVSGPGSK
jgi:prepilin-type processing-associated H-X9-DG protein